MTRLRAPCSGQKMLLSGLKDTVPSYIAMSSPSVNAVLQNNYEGVQMLLGLRGSRDSNDADRTNAHGTVKCHCVQC